MCGRTCLTLSRPELQCACTYITQIGTSPTIRKYVKPEWREEYNYGKKYQPSYNIAPSEIMPVLISADHFDDDGDKMNKDVNPDKYCKRLLVPMMWGIIPFWYKGDYRKHGMKTNNCRLEHMLESKLYGGSFQRGQRCVVLCEGYYEWQTTKSAKPSERVPYFIYMPQIDSTIKIEEKTTWDVVPIKEMHLLKMAALYDMWIDEDGNQMYSYSILTFKSNEKLSWLHHRSPAILETDKQVADWIDYKRVPYTEALSSLRPAKLITWHKVSNLVNNSRNKSNQCNKPIARLRSDIKSNIFGSQLTIYKQEKQLKMQIQTSPNDNTSELDDNTADVDDNTAVVDDKKLSIECPVRSSSSISMKFKDCRNANTIKSGKDMADNVVVQKKIKWNPKSKIMASWLNI